MMPVHSTEITSGTEPTSREPSPLPVARDKSEPNAFPSARDQICDKRSIVFTELCHRVYKRACVSNPFPFFNEQHILLVVVLCPLLRCSPTTHFIHNGRDYFLHSLHNAGCSRRKRNADMGAERPLDSVQPMRRMGSPGTWCRHLGVYPGS